MYVQKEGIANVDPIKRCPKFRFKCMVKNCKRVCPSYNAIYRHLSASKDTEHAKQWKIVKSKHSHRQIVTGRSIMNNLFQKISADDTSEPPQITYFKHGDSVYPNRAQCKHCQWEGTYETFQKHHLINKHPNEFENNKRGPKCMYQFQCNWLADKP